MQAVGPTEFQDILALQKHALERENFCRVYSERHDIEIKGLGDEPLKCDKCERWIDTLMWQIDASSFTEECVSCRPPKNEDEQLLALCAIANAIEKKKSPSLYQRLQKEEWVLVTLGPICHRVLMIIVSENVLLMLLKNKNNAAELANARKEAAKWVETGDSGSGMLTNMMESVGEKTAGWDTFTDYITGAIKGPIKIKADEVKEYVEVMFSRQCELMERLLDIHAWHRLSQISQESRVSDAYTLLLAFEGDGGSVSGKQPRVNRIGESFDGNPWYHWTMNLCNARNNREADLLIIELRSAPSWTKYPFLRKGIVLTCKFLLSFCLDSSGTNRWRLEEVVKILNDINYKEVWQLISKAIPQILQSSIELDADAMHAAIQCAIHVNQVKENRDLIDQCKIACYDALFLRVKKTSGIDGTYKNVDFVSVWQFAPKNGGKEVDWENFSTEINEALERAKDEIEIRISDGSVFNFRLSEMRKDDNVFRIRRHLIPPEIPAHWPGFGLQTLPIGAAKGNLQRLFCECRHSTCMSGHLTVEEVIHVGNLQLWNAYQMEKSAMRARHAVQSTKVHSLSQPVQPCLQELHDCDLAMNETYAFHGTSKAVAATVMKMGFDDRVSNSGLYGTGVYFSPQCCKAMGYAQQDADGLYNVFVARVVLGDPFETSTTMSNLRRPPGRDEMGKNNAFRQDYTHDYSYRSQTNSMNPCDSVVALYQGEGGGYGPPMDAETRKKQDPPVNYNRGHNEFIVFDRRQAFPEYLCRVRIERN